MKWTFWPISCYMKCVGITKVQKINPPETIKPLPDLMQMLVDMRDISKRAGHVRGAVCTVCPQLEYDAVWRDSFSRKKRKKQRNNGNSESVFFFNDSAFLLSFLPLSFSSCFLCCCLSLQDSISHPRGREVPKVSLSYTWKDHRHRYMHILDPP